MKFIAVIFFSVLTVGAHASESDHARLTWLNHPQDFVVLSSVSNSEESVFLSLSGNRFCGISLRTHSFGLRAEQLKERLLIESIEKREVGQTKNGRYIALVEDQNQFGEFFWIRTRSGKSIQEDLQSLDDTWFVDVIVEVLPCESESLRAT